MFTFEGTPKIIFGEKTFDKLPVIIGQYGKNVLLVTGGKSFIESDHYRKFLGYVNKTGFNLFKTAVSNEPSPGIIDRAVLEHRDKNIHVVVAIGGGSVLDAGKAISAMLKENHPVENYLEGVGTMKPSGDKIPFIALPTTSGTGSEATKNAVISKVGKGGYKKSLRHDNYIPDYAVVDPELSLTLPREITAHCGMDAFSQLLESYLSTTANPMTSSLALGGIEKAINSLYNLVLFEPGNINYRSDMAYASMVSGITLANAGLGTVHGIAGTLGGFYNIPHGVACGTILYETMKITVEKMLNQQKSYIDYLSKIMIIARIKSNFRINDIAEGAKIFLQMLKEWEELFYIPKLGQFGINPGELKKIAENSSNKNNPVKLSEEEIIEVLRKRL